jgi:fumarate reductase iron-sulfur subunit
MAQEQIRISIARYHPERDGAPFLQTHEVPTREGMMVLDALNYIRDEIDPTIAFRWSCRMGICGSCGMMVNGAARLTCETPLSAYAGQEIVVTPLDKFPIIRDLVSDLTVFFEDKLPGVIPWIIRRDEEEATEGEYLQTPRQLAAYHDHSACINCMLCYAACPVIGYSPGFTGPAALALARRYNLDSRDQGQGERMPAITHPEGVWDCTFVGECTVVCPKGVQPAEAIQRSKVDDITRRALGLFGGRR